MTLFTILTFAMRLQYQISVKCCERVARRLAQYEAQCEARSALLDRGNFLFCPLMGPFSFLRASVRQFICVGWNE